MKSLLVVHLDSVLDRAVLELVEDLADLCAKESGDDGGRRLVGSQAVRVGG